MISITDYINMKGKKFRKKLASGYTMCECDTLRFNEGNLPDYRCYIVQDLYAMRYDLAYAHEYKRMYAEMLESLKPGASLEVTSLGCGNMVDYWSLIEILILTRCKAPMICLTIYPTCATIIIAAAAPAICVQKTAISRC